MYPQDVDQKGRAGDHIHIGLEVIRKYYFDNYSISTDSPYGWTVTLKDHRGSIQWQVDIEDKKIAGVWENERCGIQRNLPKNIQKFIEGKL